MNDIRLLVFMLVRVPPGRNVDLILDGRVLGKDDPFVVVPHEVRAVLSGVVMYCLFEWQFSKQTRVFVSWCRSRHDVVVLRGSPVGS